MRGAATDSLRTAAAEKAPAARVSGVAVVADGERGLETILGVVQDPVFGPVVMFGLGGVFVETLRDVTFRAAPFGREEALRMIGEVKGVALLRGTRGRPPADIDALADALAALSRLAAARRDDFAAIDINPLPRPSRRAGRSRARCADRAARGALGRPSPG